MQVTAAVTHSTGAPFILKTLDLDELRPDEVRVRMVATGVCHTDAVVRDQMIPTPLPAVLGHEGAGIVESIGSAVTTVRPGDHVVLSANSCGVCLKCLSGESAYCEDLFARNFGASRADGSTPLSFEDEQISSMFFGQSSFSSVSNVAERSIVRVDKDIDLSLVAPLGCGIQTGAGAVLNDLRPPAGSSIAVFGTGAVGSAALMAAAVSGCTRIIAIDILDSRLDIALALGATHVINSRTDDVTMRLQEITAGRGVDFVLDTTAIPRVLRTAVDNLAVRGTAAVVGSSRPGTEVHLEIGESLNRGWTFKTIIQGSSVPQLFIPALIELWKQGKFPFDRLIKKYSFKDINEAFEDAEKGLTIKPVLVY
ncbi:Aryl-alcohol dehydrogenase [Arthrobacter sp. 9V]|uniref:NAD(P)-dependent alcohol dehydrogenase n=1 Tax=Arthrobacter sp. 9V TaxID=2653132 RepID=UPI0012F192D3|nr:NAD(P)-dependent alcohol dehydrogenase [Arthrobacter sp. 9V]VXC43689.1 Aryl-alcohol dehydrogenase [Arthrobacter sp. 9V]